MVAFTRRTKIKPEVNCTQRRRLCALKLNYINSQDASIVRLETSNNSGPSSSTLKQYHHHVGLIHSETSLPIQHIR